MRAPDMGEVSALLADRIEDLARDLAGDRPVRITRGELRIGEHGRFKVEMRGSRRGLWCDHASRAGGDPLDLIAHLLGTDPRGARAWALAWLGIAEGAEAPRPARRRPAPSLREPEARDTTPTAKRIWREAMPPAGTLVDSYLASRGLALEPEAPIRFHPDCPRGWDEDQRRPVEVLPAMVALMTDPATGEPCGVHRTFLSRDGSGKAPGPLPAKMMAGRAGIIRLVPDEEVTIGLGIAEGIETSLAVMQGFGWRPVWAAATAGAIRTFPVLPGIEALTIFADPDGAGMEAAEACAARWAEAGREVRIAAPPEGDFNDMIRERAA